MAREINNTASATYTYGASGQDSATSNTVTAQLLDAYAIEGHKTSLNTGFRPGENVAFQVQVINTGTQPLFSVTIEDDMGGADTPLTFLEGSGSLNIDGTITQIIPSATNPLTFVLTQPLAAGDTAVVSYVAKANSSLPTSVTEITNTVTIFGREQSNLGNQIFVTPNPSVTLPIEDFAQVEMLKEISSTEIASGEPFSYTITLSNSGNVDANNIIITDTLPEGFVISDISSLTNGQTTTFDAADYNVDTTTNTLTLPANSTKQIGVSAKVDGVRGTTVVTIAGVINS